jgi:CHAT domain-containing protein
MFAFCLLLSGFLPCRWPASAAHPQDFHRRAEELIQRGEAELTARGDWRAAIAFFEHSLDLACQLKDDALMSRSLSGLAYAYVELAESDKALSLAEEALAAARRAGDRRLEAWALDYIGNAYYYPGDFARALDHFQASLPIMRAVEDRFGEATALKDIGIIYKYLGQYDEAIEFLHEALDIFRHLKASDQMRSALENLGTAYVTLGAYSQALDFYEQAFEIAKETQDAEGVSAVLIRLGYLYLDLNEPERALDHLQQGLAMADRLDRHHDQEWALSGLSGALFELGQIEASREALRRLFDFHRRINKELGMADDLEGFGYFHLEGEPAVALDYFRRALAIYEKYESPLNRRIDVSLGRAYRRLGDLDRAIEYYEQAIEKLESVRGKLASEQHRASFLGKHQQVYRELIETLMERHERTPDAGDDVRAFAIFERAKARALVEAIAQARRDIDGAMEPDLRHQEQQLSARIAGLQKRLIEANAAKEERRQILKDLSQTEQEFDRLIVRIKRHTPRHAALRYPDPLSLKSAQALLDESAALLAYAITNDHLFAFLLTARSFHAQRLAASPKAVAARVQGYLDLVAEDEDAGWQESSHRLYTELVAPVRQYLPAEINQLIIIPDGVLHYLPFETLIRDQGSGIRDQGSPNRKIRNPQSAIRNPQYLLEDFTISYAPSATVLAELAAFRPTLNPAARADLLMFANPTLAPALLAQSTPRRAAERTRALYDDEGLQITPIPFSAAEAKVIAQYVGQRGRVYTGSEASERRAKTDSLDHFRVIHFATHGLISQQMPARSALVLSAGDEDPEDGFLQAREIYHLKLASDLVVLSACQTARGQILAGEGVQGLAQAFFHAGAQSVVASLWNVKDERTAAFMEAFYRHLAEGQPKAAALRAAKLDLLRDRATSAPRDWAPFILIGEADQPLPISGPTWWLQMRGWVLLGSAMLLMGLITFSLFRKRARQPIKTPSDCRAGWSPGQR